MKKDINEILNLISDTENFKHNDSLSNLINAEQDDELTEYDLDMVAAAAKADYEKFKLYLENRIGD